MADEKEATPPPAPPPEDLLNSVKSLAEAPRVKPLGNQGAKSKISRTEVEKQIRQTVQECLEFSRAYLVHFSYVDSDDVLHHESFNFFMPMDSLPEVEAEFQIFTKSIRPEVPQQVLPKAKEGS